MDPAPHREPEGNERWMVFGAGLVGLAFLIGIVLEDYEPKRLAPVFMLLSYFPLIALHELGHALVARVFGWDVEEIVVGFGTVVFRFELRGVPVTVKAYPISGWVRPAPTSMRSVRLASALIYLAGPATELLVAAGLLFAVGPSRFFELSTSIPIIAAQSVALAATLDAVLNLFPRRAQTERGEGMTDGMGFIVSLLRPRESYRRAVLAVHEERIEEAGYGGNLEALVRLCERAHEALGPDPHLVSVMRTALVRCARGASLSAALEESGLPPPLRARLLR